MTASVRGPEAAQRQPGRFGRALIRLLMKPARIVENTPLAEGFRRLTLESPAFKGLPWVPGQKIQVAMGSAFVARTFTPIDWDADAGRTRIVGYAHGDGPGSAWIADAQPGDSCDVFGPRASLDVGHAGPRVMIGDETSIGLALAASRRAASGASRYLFEVNALAHARDALARLDLAGVELFERTPGDTHLAGIAHRLPALAAAGARFVLTGKASSVQQLRRALKTSGVAASRILAKPYWAPGRTGLD